MPKSTPPGTKHRKSRRYGPLSSSARTSHSRQKSTRSRESDSILFNESLPTIYLLILSHGKVVFVPDSPPKPRMVRIPPEIQYMNKVTYAPLGVSSFSVGHNERKITDSVMSIISDANSRGSIIRGSHLSKELESHVEIQSPEEIKAIQKSQAKVGISLVDSGFADSYLLGRLAGQLYQSVEYTESHPAQLMEKEYHTSSSNPNFDIFVVYTKNAHSNLQSQLQPGDRILRPVPSARGNAMNVARSLSNNPVGITTSRLLEFMSSFGYENVILIDYSCDICCETGSCERIPRDVIRNYRQMILDSNGMFGRGRNKNKTRRPEKKRTSKKT